MTSRVPTTIFYQTILEKMSLGFQRTSPPQEKSHSVKTAQGVIEFCLVRSIRRRSIEIRVLDHQSIRVRAPRFSSESDIAAFIREKAAWIQRKFVEAARRQAHLAKRKYAHDQDFLFLGAKYPLNVNPTQRRRVQIDFDGRQWKIHVPILESGEHQQEQLIRAQLVKWYRQQAGEIFGGRVFHYTRLMGLKPQKVVVKTQKRIWGSCDYRKQNIYLNWLLVLSPLDVIDYVIVHELCHLEVPNHSKRFWRKVAGVLPDYQIRQQWLKNNALDLLLP